MFVGDETWEEYSVDAISKVLDCLTPENLIVMVQTHDPSIEYEFRDQYFNMQYSVEPLDAALVEDIKAIEVHSDFKLPRPNQFMCHDLKPISDAEKPAVPATQPTLLIHNERGEVWHKKDDTFFTPKGALSIEFVLPKAVRELPGAMQLLETFKKLVERALRVPMDDAYLAGMSYHLQTSYNSMCVNIMGFTPKMMALAEVILKHIQFAGPQDLHFSIIKEEMLTDYNGFVNDEPDRQGVNWLREVLGLRTQNIEAKIKFIESMRLEDAQDFIRQALQNFYVKICGVGYFEEQTLLDIYSLVQTTFKPGTMPEDEICTPYFMLQKPGRHIIHKQSPNEHSCHSAIIHNIYPGNESNVKIAVYLDLVSSLAHSEMFTRLRTNETLGYIVGCGSSTTYSNFHYIRFEIVSKCNPVYLQLRLDKFYRIFRDEFLANLTQEDLDSRINASIKTLEQPYTSIYSEYMRYANAIDSDLYDFSCKQEMIEVLKRVTKQELLEFWDTKLAPLDPGRSPSLIAHVYSSKIHMPTLEDRQEYSAVICALHGCLEQSGIVGLGYADMCELVSRICEETT
ncbi:metalloprotease, partial [Spiromyces aspiralis]